MKTILILQSNPRRDLGLNEEIRELVNVIEQSRSREQFEVEVALAVRPQDLQRLIFKSEPQIVHFCGHGTGDRGLVLQNETGQEQRVSTAALSDLFELFAEQINCILLNACYSEVQANAIAQHINYVVGMRQEIRDTAAIAFATAFYQALGYGESIERAYRSGCTQIHLTQAHLALHGDSTVRSISADASRKLEAIDVDNTPERISIPEHLQPILKRKQDLTQPNYTLMTRPIENPTEIPRTSINQISQQEEIERSLVVGKNNFGVASEIEYTALKKFLEAANWQAAEEETQRIMLAAIGQTNGYLGEADIKSFPCAVLRQIDQLWVRYSDGRFGFSVQREIFLNCGAKLDGKHDQTVWLKFANQVGWLKADALIFYSEATFSDANPPGYFPFKIYREACLKIGLCASWILRFVACEI